VSKRFTDTEKWDDPWFRRLSPSHKHAWNYLCDQVDNAGVIDLDRELAEFRIGESVDWDAFFEACGERIRQLPNGKLWVVGFVKFQYGELKDTSNLHKSVMGLLARHDISPGDSHAMPMPSAGDGQGTMEAPRGLQVKVKVKEEVKVKARGGCKGETPEADPVPERIHNSTRLADAVRRWLAYKAERRESYKPTGLQALLSRAENVAMESGAHTVVEMIDRAMAGGWKGWDHPDSGSRGSPRAASNASKPSHVYDPNLETNDAF
jgi:hypothetical protein